MSAPLELPPVVPVDALRRRADRFRCEPYRATISAQTCLARQSRAADQQTESRLQNSGQVRNRLVGDYEKCLYCGVGDVVRQRVAENGGDGGT